MLTVGQLKIYLRRIVNNMMLNKNKIYLTAHAGCMSTQMDSIESILSGINYGADIIEIDLNIDEAENLILCHDIPKKHSDYASFYEVLEILKASNGLLLNIDIKNIHVLEKLKEFISIYDMKNRVFFTGLDYEQICQNKGSLSGYTYFLNLDSPKLDLMKLTDITYLTNLLDDLCALNIIGININQKYATTELLTICKEKNLFSSVWTIEDTEEMLRLISLKVNSITTKQVNILKSLI